MSLWRDIAAQIGAVTGEAFEAPDPCAVGGGCINRSFTIGDADRGYFVKTNSAARLDMFEAEAEGLAALATCNAIAVPRVVCSGVSDGHGYLVMSHLRLGHAPAGGWRLAGERLAALHRCTAAKFGWHRDNTIGATVQPNAWDADWIAFWRRQRLGFQLQEAARNGHRGRIQALGERLLERFPVLVDHAPQPSLLHGDLWGGNIGFTVEGEPVIFDPATYYGDREAELAMTELFGGFGRDFYAAYEADWPLDAGYRVRKTLYNLYHVLNHLNLFGGGYGAQAERMMQSLLAEC